MRPSLLARLAWLTCVALAGCRQADTVLAVTVVGSQTELRQLDVEVSIGEQRRTFAVPPEPRAITLPATFTLRVDASYQGELSVQVVGLDARGVRIAEGEERVPSFRAHAITALEVRLRDATDAPVDGGSDAAPRADGGADASGDARTDAHDAAVDARADGGTPDATDVPLDGGVRG